MDFSKIKAPVRAQFDEMTQHEMFRAAVEKDELWERYIASFPPGSNPIVRQRTEHDCSCCRQFVRAVGNVVAVIDGKIATIWDVTTDEPAYQAVVDAMAALVRSRPIASIFLHNERSVGQDKNFEDDGGSVRAWEHFHVNIPHGRNRGKNYYCNGPDIATKVGEARALRDVLARSLSELSMDSVDTVLELVGQNSLYRGAEHKFAVDAFRKLKVEHDRLPEGDARDAFVWVHSASAPVAVSKIRNTSIGTLLTDLSEGLPLEDAVRKFEAMVAPANYKRPTALVTQAMVDKAKAAVADLGLASALERRYAALADISVNDIIFADRHVRPAMKDDVFGGIATKSTVPKNLDRVETIPVDKFVAEVVPNIDTMEVMFENRHASNLVSLVAPVHADAKPLFKWGNNFSWSYNGDVADSLKERVKRAGGNVSGDLCCRLSWFNFDDLDFHMVEPHGEEIFFGHKRSVVTGGMLDVDMNAGAGVTREPVENIFYGTRNRMAEGAYHLYVHQYCRREGVGPGFEVEIDWLGDVTRYAYDKVVSGNITVARFRYSHARGIEITESLPASTASKKLWGVSTQDFHRVNLMLLSPNHWGERGVGNKHYFFMLDGCVSDGQARGFFNEFLRPELDKHRKVIEIVGSKMKTAETANQLSGLGFSDTKREEVLVRVKGSFSRILKVAI
jgi:hypothetical protein